MACDRCSKDALCEACKAEVQRRVQRLMRETTEREVHFE